MTTAPDLTLRDTQLLHLIALEGLVYREIAQRMHLRPNSVKVYVLRLYRKLNLDLHYKSSGRGNPPLRLAIWYWKNRLEREETETHGLGQS